MSERQITRIFGLVLGAVLACGLILNAFAY